MSKPILPVLTILAALFICVKANSYSEADMPYCLADSTNTTCSDFQAFPAVKDFYCLPGDESLSLLQTKAILAKPKRRRRKPKRSRRVISNEERSRSTRVFLTNKTLPKIRKWKAATAVRPLWQKTLRCSGPTMDDCEECVGNKNCWGDCTKQAQVKWGGDKCVYINKQNKWKRFVILIHVRCEGRMTPKMRPMFINRGVMNLYWDEKLLKSFSKTGGGYWHTSIQTEHMGGNTFIVEFAPSNLMNAFGSFNDLSFLFRTEFASCLDSKACLEQHGPLGDQAGLPLRTSSVLMHQCLKTGMDNVSVQSVAGSCKKWKACLKKSDPSGEYERRLLTMLEASGVATAATAHSSLKQHLPPPQLGKGSGKCIYPPHEDPLSWNCDCYEDMMQRCKDIGASMEMEVCLRAQFCEHPHTCQHWKDSTCNEQKVADMSRRLKSALLEMDGLNSLMTRVSQKDTKATLAADLDHTTGHKACA
eukprot:gnl/TRDRNA2_/TRDRNA2_176392_c0_seq72.p1 gnl/TRDRNA2_/TRDRNA2_176392_c0~~gnl/TRDRNA2_/TRDRNA2_176392_c0_seq72.p1  ORF type:complete len:475 (-),score=56.95 gnl/TRDRNA2_/TRDRNA2_176392_c0_seq72:62-1486(-)